MKAGVTKTIRIAQDFSRTPGARFRRDGPGSGEAFREDLLEPALEKLGTGEVLTVVFDGAAGYATSFLEEAFGGLVRKLGPGCAGRLRLVADEDPLLVEEVKRYMREAS